ncbi:26003_t:CDS:2, partial [Racocetra persica]
LLRLHDPRIVSHLSGIDENVDEISTSKPLINASPFVQNSILSPDKSSTIGDEHSHESTNDFTRNQDPLDALKNSKGNDINIKEQGIPAVSVKKQAVKTAFEEASKAVRNATTAYEELMQVLPPGMKFDVESTDYVSSNLSVLEELLGVIELDDASRVMNFQNFSSASTSNKPIESCSIDMTKEITRKDSKIDSDSIDVNNKNIQLGMQVLIGYDDHVFSECDPNELGNIISTKSQKHEQLKEVKEKMNDANYVHQNDSKSLDPIDNKFTTKIEVSKKPSRTVPKTSKNLKVKRYNTRSTDGTRKLRVMFDGVQAGNQKSKNDINSKQKKKSNPQKMPINTKETLKNTRSKTSIKMPTIPKGSFGYFFEDYYAKVKVSHPNESLTQ